MSDPAEKKDHINRILAAIVTYDRRELLLECIEALRRQTCKDFDILVIDNASTDGTEEALRPLIDDKTILYRRMKRNTGGAGGFNAAMRYAVMAGYDYVWVMDDDAEPQREALEEMVKVMHSIHRKWGFISGKAVWMDGSLCRMNKQKLIRGGLCREATFVSMMLPVDVIKEAGLPVRDFFIWADDIEYSRRISERYPCFYAEKSIVKHKTPFNTGSDISADSIDRIERYRYAYRNEVYIAKKEGAVRSIYQLCRIIHHIFRVMIYSRSYRIHRISIILSGSLRGLRFDPVI